MKKITPRILRIRLIDGSLVTGQLNLERHPGYERVSDLLTINTETFIVMMGVSVNRSDLDATQRYKTLCINKDHIIWAAPDEDQ